MTTSLITISSMDVRTILTGKGRFLAEEIWQGIFYKISWKPENFSFCFWLFYLRLRHNNDHVGSWLIARAVFQRIFCRSFVSHNLVAGKKVQLLNEIESYITATVYSIGKTVKFKSALWGRVTALMGERQKRFAQLLSLSVLNLFYGNPDKIMHERFPFNSNSLDRTKK